MPEQKPSKRLFLSQAASCTHRRYLRLSFPPPDGQETPVPEEESVFHRQGVSFKHLQKNSGVLKDTAHFIVPFRKKSRKKSIFFLFLLKSAMKTIICHSIHYYSTNSYFCNKEPFVFVFNLTFCQFIIVLFIFVWFMIIIGLLLLLR